jgi:hypothetical protein
MSRALGLSVFQLTKGDSSARADSFGHCGYTVTFEGFYSEKLDTIAILIARDINHITFRGNIRFGEIHATRA